MRFRVVLAIGLGLASAPVRADGPASVWSFIQSRIGAPPSATSLAAAKANAAALQPSAAAGTTATVVSDVQIGTAGNVYVGTDILRPDGLLAWQDAVNNGVWYCTLDPATGEMSPASGKGQFVSTAASFTGDLASFLPTGMGHPGTHNGPQWGNSREGVGVYFTNVDSRSVYQQAKMLLRNQPNFIIETFTSGGTNHRLGNLPSQDANDNNPRVLFLEIPVGSPTGITQANQHPFWKLDLLAQPEQAVPSDGFSFNGQRWVPGEHALVTFVQDAQGTLQVAKFNTDTSALTFLTTGPKKHAEAEIVIDPATGKATWMTCIEDDAAVAVFQLQGTAWVKTNTIVPLVRPPLFGRPFTIFAVKPFVVRGKLYFFYNVFVGNQPIDVINPIDIYLGSADGTINKPLTPGGFFNYSVNPQYYIGSTDNRVYLYYYTSLPLPYIINYSKFHRLTFTID